MHRRLLPLCLMLFLFLLFTACEADTPVTNTGVTEPGTFALDLPRALQRAGVVASAPRVRLDNGTDIKMQSAANDRWSGSIALEPNTEHSLSIQWIEQYEGRELTLAQLEKTFTVGSGATQVVLNTTEYDTNLDDDDDRFSNVQEFVAGSDPFNPLNVIIGRVPTDNAPTIDGFGVAYDANSFILSGEWSVATQLDVLGQTLFVDNLMVDRESVEINGEPYHRWAAVHDDIYLYILVMTDDQGQAFGDSAQLWQDDSIEIYIDGNNSKSSEYNDDDDINMQIALLRENSTSGNTNASGIGRLVRGVFSAPLPSDMEYAVGLGIGPFSLATPKAPRQDFYEIRLNLQELGIERGRKFGFEVQVNDDDNGDSRDSKWSWIHPPLGSDLEPDQTWNNPSLMGTAMLD